MLHVSRPTFVGVSRTALALAVGVLAGSCSTPAATPPATSPPPQYATRRVDLGGYSIAVRCAGDGPKTVVFVSGLAQPGGPAWVQSAVPDDVAANARVCTYDRPGLGDSDPGPPERPRSVPANVEELERLIDTGTFAAPVVLVAQGYGTFIARQVAKDRVRAVSGLVLVDPPLEPLEPLEAGLPGAPLTAGEQAEYDAVADLNTNLGAYGAGALPPPPVPTVVLGVDDLPPLPPDAPDGAPSGLSGTAPRGGVHRRDLQRQLALKGPFGSFEHMTGSGSMVQYWNRAAVTSAVRHLVADQRSGR